MRVRVEISPAAGDLYIAKPEDPLPECRLDVAVGTLRVAVKHRSFNTIRVLPKLGAAGFTLNAQDYPTVGDLAAVLEAHLEILGAFEKSGKHSPNENAFDPKEWARLSRKLYHVSTLLRHSRTD